MVYNPIFEEEVERKKELKQLKKEIKHRARSENIAQVINRVYNLLKSKPILTIYALLHPVLDLIKTTRAKEV